MDKLQSFATTSSPTFNDLIKKAFENIVGKGENAGLLFPQCFIPYQKHRLSS